MNLVAILWGKWEFVQIFEMHRSKINYLIFCHISVWQSFIFILMIQSLNEMYILNGFLLFMSQGQYGIICLEDLIHEIYSAEKNFKVVNNFLCPFRLSVPRHGAKDKVGLLKDVGDPGPRAEDINTIIRKLNWANRLSWTAVLSPSFRLNHQKRENWASMPL